MSSFQGRSVLITGAAGGIGGATARLLASRGARLALTDLSDEPLQALASALRNQGAEVHATACDLGYPEAVERTVEQALEHLGKLDGVVNNAAALGPHMSPQFDRDVETTAIEVWDEAYRINLRGVVLVCKAALPHLVAAGGGAVVNVASNLALQGAPIQNAYSASKAAVIQLTRCIAASHGRKGVRCNAVLPGLTLTQTVVNHMPAGLRQAVCAETDTGVLGRPEQIAAAIAFLVSDESANMTGQVLASDGGLSTHAPGCFAASAAARSNG